MSEKKSKIVLIGSGAVGSTFAYTVLLQGLAHELVLIDANQDKAEGDALDLNHGMLLAHPMKIHAGDYSDCAEADIIVLTAGAAQKPGETRLDLMRRNVAIFDSILSQVTRYNNDGILLIATNPVDILTQVALKLSGWPSNRVIGSGTLLDSSRFRYLVGKRLKVDPRSIHGLIIGEHGDSEVPLWSSLQVAGMPQNDLPQNHPWHLTAPDKKVITEDTRRAAYHIIEKKGATYYAIALALARICEAILKDQRSVLPVSHPFEPDPDIGPVCLGIPCVIGRNGVEETVPFPLSKGERIELRKSAQTLKRFMDQLGF
ncbi:L-lactate dehydrogenase [Desmospora profundinema]|uniref:L-lactate dehydrogenase n=1 Tax=Desmospora profundinema TaxID=1571184 RepID=A0ABU1IN20_9BACL|nr:L-lactate dehydrogenase [Desmospora profundinema]MDR6226133.1 L-lactate dehydrogenase [Desmospora profundinema]